MENLKSKIDEVIETLEFDKDKAVFSMTPTEDENKRILELKAGSWDSNDIWFFIDEKDKIHPMVPFDAIKNLAVTLSEAKQENVKLHLEKAILQLMPVDYNDVLAVVTMRIKDNLENNKNFHKKFDVYEIARDVKRDFPNLFIKLPEQFLEMRIDNND